MPDEAMLCTLNNVEWCDTICRSHGLATTLTPEIWLQPRPGPPYYSNAITLSRTASKTQYAAIENLKSALPGGFSIKDSFASLDLAAEKFHPLFDAEWVFRDPPPTAAAPQKSGWFKVETEHALLRWESVWAANGSPTATRVFLPALLAEPRIAFFAVEGQGKIAAGCAANLSRGDVVGFSNFFAAAPDRNRLRAEAIAQVAAFAPGAPIVGYDRDAELAGLLALGFRSVGKLRVWISPA